MTKDSQPTARPIQRQPKPLTEANSPLLYDVSPIGMFQTDRDGHCIYANPKALQLSGLSLEQYLGKGWLSSLHPDDRDRVEAHWSAFRQQAMKDPCATFDLECRWQRPDQSIIWVWMQAVPQLSSTGELTGYVGTLTDISHRKQAELELQAAKIAAEKANQAKSRFLANMSHELRTPLNAILGFSQLLVHHPSLLPEQQEQIAVIYRSGEHLLSLINDVLELSRIEAGQTSRITNEFNLVEFLSTLEQLFSQYAQQKGLELRFEPAPILPHHIQTDERKLRQVLINLIGNAIKFTQQGSVIVRVDHAATPSPSHSPISTPQSLIFQVSDTGPGIAADELDSIFEPFFQSQTPSSNQEGVGLGLSMSQQFVRLLGGELTVSSVPGQGATFQFEIPVEFVDPCSIAASPYVQQAIAPESYRLQADSFQVMPLDWIQRLHQASIQLNPRQVLILVEQIPVEHIALAQALREKVSNFDFEQIMELTEIAQRRKQA